MRDQYFGASGRETSSKKLKRAALETGAPNETSKVDRYGRAYATGKAAQAVARVWIKPGSGKIQVNSRDPEVYFARPALLAVIQQPFVASGREGQYDVFVTTAGGGLSLQASAIRHGISKALVYFEPNLRSALVKAGFVTKTLAAVRPQKAKAARKSFLLSEEDAKALAYKVLQTEVSLNATKQAMHMLDADRAARKFTIAAAKAVRTADSVLNKMQQANASIQEFNDRIIARLNEL